MPIQNIFRSKTFMLEPLFISWRLKKYFLLTLISNRLTSQIVQRTLTLAQTLTSDPYNRGPLKRRQSVHWLTGRGVCHTPLYSLDNFFEVLSKINSLCGVKELPHTPSSTSKGRWSGCQSSSSNPGVDPSLKIYPNPERSMLFTGLI